MTIKLRFKNSKLVVDYKLVLLYNKIVVNSKLEVGLFTKRERKTAENKQAIIRVLLEKMKHEDINDIKISYLCRRSGVSQASFYNYFPHKSDMLIYYIQLWSVSTIWKAKNRCNKSGLTVIENIFKETAKDIVEHPNMMAEIISFQAKWKPPEEGWPEINKVDKIIAFPEFKGVEKIPAHGFDSILLSNLENAVESGELPKSTDIMTLVITLSSIFFGVPMLLGHIPAEYMEDIYLQQLNLVWAGARSKYGKEA